ncbi:MAG TPA: DUF885 family protein, partial [Phycisphaerales bacterium]|nr:DUF885 family protein [Phycisphaerales bacterium]
GVAAVTQSELAMARPGQADDLADYINRFAEDSSTFTRYHSTRWSEASIDRHEAFLRARLDELMRLDLEPLPSTARIDAVLLRNDIRGDIARLQLGRRQLADMADLLSVRTIIVPLEEARWKTNPPHVIEPRAAADELARIPGLVKTVRERVEAWRRLAPDEKSRAGASGADGPLAVDAVTAQRAAGALSSLSATLRTWYDGRNAYEPGFGWWCSKPYGEAQKAIDDFAKFLREDIAGVKGKPDDPLIGDPIGREALLAELRNECVAATPEELIEIGEREMAWCIEQARAAARAMGFYEGGGDWKAALAKVKEDTAPAGEQGAYVIGVAREAIDFVKRRDLVTVPPMCESYWKPSMLSAESQRTLPFAVYFPQAIGIASPTDGMAHDDKVMSMRGNNRRFTRIVVPHELIPGHHLQSFYAAREKPYRRRFSTPFYVEGWALYWEMKLWDLSEPASLDTVPAAAPSADPWAKSPEDRLGMLFWRMHRCARITVSLKFHLGEMSPKQMIDYLMENVGHERANATAEVRRYIGGDYGPLYQAGYMIGGKQLRALHAELVPARMTEKQFNDAVLRCGPIPIELVRAELLGADGPALTLESEASWRFR